MTIGPGDHLTLIDASSYIYRGHFASTADDDAYNVNHRGEPIGALKKFADRLYGWRRFGACGRYPTHMAAVFDASRRSFRHDIYPAYKEGRSETPDDLKRQLPLMRDVARALGVCCAEQIGFEADDLIASYGLTAVEAGASVLIISGDKDFMQLVRPGIMLFEPARGIEGYEGYHAEKRIGFDEVVAKFGVPPHLVCDVQALAGDSSDRVPGVRGIGTKTAAELVLQFGSLEGVLANAEKVPQPKRREALIRDADLARTCLKLVTLCSTVDYETDLDDMRVQPLEDHLAEALTFAEHHGLRLAQRIKDGIAYADR